MARAAAPGCKSASRVHSAGHRRRTRLHADVTSSAGATITAAEPWRATVISHELAHTVTTHTAGLLGMDALRPQVGARTSALLLPDSCRSRLSIPAVDAALDTWGSERLLCSRRVFFLLRLFFAPAAQGCLAASTASLLPLAAETKAREVRREIELRTGLGYARAWIATGSRVPPGAIESRRAYNSVLAADDPPPDVTSVHPGNLAVLQRQRSCPERGPERGPRAIIHSLVEDRASSRAAARAASRFSTA